MTDAAHSLPDDDRHPDNPAPEADRPDWLVSAEQIVADERPRGEETDGDGLRLVAAGEVSAAVPIERPKIPVRGEAKKDSEPKKPAGPVAWSAAASSVPKLKLDTPLSAPSPAGAPRPGVPVKAEPIRGYGTAAGYSPGPAVLPLRSGPAMDEEAEDEFSAFPDDTGPAGPVLASAQRRLDEPFWVVALDAIRSNPRVQWVALAAVLVPLLAWIFWPRSEPGVSLKTLRSEASRWDGQVVRINGRVGEVFHVGAGWAFNLHQGRDTIVVFTRGAAPRTRDKVSIAGSVSTGYLDGQPRQAIFAEP